MCVLLEILIFFFIYNKPQIVNEKNVNKVFCNASSNYYYVYKSGNIIKTWSHQDNVFKLAWAQTIK